MKQTTIFFLLSNIQFIPSIPISIEQIPITLW